MMTAYLAEIPETSSPELLVFDYSGIVEGLVEAYKQMRVGRRYHSHFVKFVDNLLSIAGRQRSRSNQRLSRKNYISNSFGELFVGGAGPKKPQ